MENTPSLPQSNTPTAASTTPKPPSALDTALLTYAAQLRQLMGDKPATFKDIKAHALQQIADMQPRDAVEELLMAQMLITHARVNYHARSLTVQKDLSWVEMTNIAMDRAANTFRRQAETLAKLREPRRYRRTSATTIRAIKSKQIEGTTHAEENARQADPEKAEKTATPDPQNQTVAEIHGTEISRG